MKQGNFIKKSVLVLALVVTVIAGADARIGETVSQCKERYGDSLETLEPKVSESDEEALRFRKSGIDIRVEFKAGKAWSISFSKRGITDTERATLLKANSEGSLWSGPIDFGGRDYWISDIGKMIAMQRKIGARQIVQVVTRDYVKAADTRRKEHEAMIGTPQLEKYLKSLGGNTRLEGF